MKLSFGMQRRVTDRQTEWPNGRVSGQAVVVSGRTFTAKARQTTWDLWWTEWACDGVFPKYF
jgi:hypothetical protein